MKSVYTSKVLNIQIQINKRDTMKKIQLLSILVIFIFAITALPNTVYDYDMVRSEGETSYDNNHVISEEMAGRRTICLNFSMPTLFEDDNYARVIAHGAEASISHRGKPILPVHKTTMSFPFGTKITDVYCDVNDARTLPLSQKILPAPEPAIYGTETEPVFAMNKDIYQSDEFYPNDWCKISTGGGLNSDNERKTFITVQTFPARYNPVKDILLYVEDITVTLHYLEPKESLLTATDEFDLVIIAPEAFSSNIQPLINHKNDIGVKTFIKTTEEIYYEYDGVDKPEQIKYFIKDAIEMWGIKYVLLVGGLKSPLYGNPRDDANQGSKDWYVPVRYTNLDERSSFSDPGFISDLYFMDIYDGEGQFSSWDSNGNGIFAEWKSFSSKDVIDFYPDVYVGRLACRNNFEVKTVVNKIITYESSPIDPSWYKRMVLVGGDGFDDSAYGTSWPEEELWCDKFLSYMEDVEPVKLYASNRDTDMDYTPLTENIIREMNTGCGYVIFEGHGNPYCWITHWPGEFNEPISDGGISIFDFPKIQNGDKLPICCIAGGCHNSLFNISLITTALDRDNSRHLMTYGVPTPECLGWSFVRKRGGGAIANFGYPSSTYTSAGENGDLDGDGNNEPDIFEALRSYMVQQYYKLFGEGTEFLGDVAGGAVRNYLHAFPGMDDQLDAKIIEQVIFFGDPSLKIAGYP